MGDARASSAKNNISISFAVVASALSLFFFLLYPAASVYAAGGDGTGGGSGDSPVTLSGAYLANVSGNVSTGSDSIDGSPAVPQKPTIKLVFSVNVVDNTIWPSPNQSCITMQDSSGNAVPVNVFRIDPGANFEERNNIFVSPASPLAPGTQYRLSISPSLTGKNGNTSGQTVSISFTTAGTAGSSGNQSSGGTAQNNAAASTDKSDTSTYEMAPNSSSASTATAKKDDGAKKKKTGGVPAAWWALAFVVLVGAIVAAGESYLRTKKNKGKSENVSKEKDKNDLPKGGG